MPRETTYGFEAEFDINATSVINGLYGLDLAGDDHLHGYHCDCDTCQFRNGFPFRGQTDSSCSGEIISDIFGSSRHWDRAYSDERSFINDLCRVAIDVDAEPGFRSGFHVHVAIDNLTNAQMAESLYQYIRWEPVLCRIAGGRWNTQRDNNESVRSLMSYLFEDTFRLPLTANNLHTTEGAWSELTKLDFLMRHRRSDRHSNLNIGTQHRPTWEFRLWNSTRAAWRMEMFCDLSMAWVDPDFVAQVGSMLPPQRIRRPSAGIRTLRNAADASGYAILAEHLERQAVYLDEKANTAPSTLTMG